MLALIIIRSSLILLCLKVAADPLRSFGYSVWHLLVLPRGYLIRSLIVEFLGLVVLDILVQILISLVLGHLVNVFLFIKGLALGFINFLRFLH